MKSIIRICAILAIMLVVAGCDSSPTVETVTLAEARQGFKTELVTRQSDPEPLPEPPPEVFRKVLYSAPVGKLGAYLTPDPGDGKKHPAIVWITGGECNTIGDLWSPAPADNDQTASAYRENGVVLMFPSLRGGNDNPGKMEGFLGEIDDIGAAADFLAAQPYVDANRIYLGGHSSGGTMVLLAAETTDRFRAVFAFGPVEDVAGYGADFLPFKPTAAELRLREPARWLHGIKTPTFVFEGAKDPGNIDSLMMMKAASRNALCQFFPVSGVDHFSILDPINRLIVEKIHADTGGAVNISFTEQEVNRRAGGR